jgi:hypothetical protein
MKVKNIQLIPSILSKMSQNSILAILANFSRTGFNGSSFAFRPETENATTKS